MLVKIKKVVVQEKDGKTLLAFPIQQNLEVLEVEGDYRRSKFYKLNVHQEYEAIIKDASIDGVQIIEVDYDVIPRYDQVAFWYMRGDLRFIFIIDET